MAERLGIDYDSIKGANPRLIYCSISAFGPDGPWSEKPGLDSLAQALGGLMAITGEPDGGPVLCGAPVADTLGGMLAIQGILTALIARAANGQGQRVDASLLNGMLFAHTARLSVFHETGETLPRYGSGHPEIVPYQAFQAADGWLFVAAWVERLWLPFCKAVGMDALGSDPRFADAKGSPHPPRRARDDPCPGVPRAPGGPLDGGPRAGRRALRAGQRLPACWSATRR